MKIKTFQQKRLERGVTLYLSSSMLYLIALVLCNSLPIYTSYLRNQTLRFLLLLFVGYLIFSPLYYFLRTTPTSTNKPYLVCRYILRSIRVRHFQDIKSDEKVALLFILVKLFFLPLMFNFFFGNISGLQGHLNNFKLFPFALFLIFTLDTLVFAFGYTFEFKSLKNVVKSVEPTFLGWFVTLICYPPFNSIVGNYIPWGSNDYAFFFNDTFTTIARILLVFLLLIYLAATFALGPKASNLTNRGIISRFPYSVVRHPAYISKISVWWITLLPYLSWPFALGMLFWTFIYYMRAITEERHLCFDEEYVKYKKEVKYKFIPYIW
jgi:protein-S-isoprenylcysteine O-methyltransferase Ste14